jgi:hypothetical protein
MRDAEPSSVGAVDGLLHQLKQVATLWAPYRRRYERELHSSMKSALFAFLLHRDSGEFKIKLVMGDVRFP